MVGRGRLVRPSRGIRQAAHGAIRECGYAPDPPVWKEPLGLRIEAVRRVPVACHCLMLPHAKDVMCG